MYLRGADKRLLDEESVFSRMFGYLGGMFGKRHPQEVPNRYDLCKNNAPV